MKLTERLSALKSRGWTCEHPDFRHAINSGGISYSCVWCLGPVPGYAGIQAVYLDVAGGTVLLTGPEHRDFDWQEFLNLLDGFTDVVPPKPASGQKTLWEDEG